MTKKSSKYPKFSSFSRLLAHFASLSTMEYKGSECSTAGPELVGDNFFLARGGGGGGITELKILSSPAIFEKTSISRPPSESRFRLTGLQLSEELIGSDIRLLGPLFPLTSRVAPNFALIQTSEDLRWTAFSDFGVEVSTQVLATFSGPLFKFSVGL